VSFALLLGSPAIARASEAATPQTPTTPVKPTGEQKPPAPNTPEAMAQEHRHDAPEPSPATVPEPRQPVSGAEVEYGKVADLPVRGYLARPDAASGPLPGLIVVHEWWGLNENIKAMTRRLAGEGYQALAIDLFGGPVATDPTAARAQVEKVMADRLPAIENIRQAYSFLVRQGSAKVGSIGWCFGGGWALGAGQILPADLDAVVVYYGQLETGLEALRPLRMPVAGFFGAKDRAIPVETVRAFEKTMKELGKDVEVHIYENAGHAFANPSGGSYNAEAATDAWLRTVAFLDRTLKSEAPTAAPAAPGS
jgi:carboxymethylenebutenolidase